MIVLFLLFFYVFNNKFEFEFFMFLFLVLFVSICRQLSFLILVFRSIKSRSSRVYGFDDQIYIYIDRD